MLPADAPAIEAGPRRHHARHRRPDDVFEADRPSLAAIAGAGAGVAPYLLVMPETLEGGSVANTASPSAEPAFS